MPLTAPIFGQATGTPSAPSAPGTFGAQLPNYRNPPSGTTGGPQINSQIFGNAPSTGVTGSGLIGILNAQSKDSIYTAQDRANYQRAAEYMAAGQDEYARGAQQDANLGQQILEGYDARIPGLLNRQAAGAQTNINNLAGNVNALTNDYDAARNANLNTTGAAADATYDAYKKGLQFQNAGFGQRTTETNKRLREGSNILNFTLDQVNAGQTLNHKFQTNEADRRRSDQFNVEQGYGERATNLNDLLGLRGREAASDINRQFNRNQGDSRQSLVGRGLYNTTIMDSVGRGIEEDRSRELRGLDEQVREQELAQRERLSGDTLSAQERGIALKNQLTQQVATQRERALDRSAGLGVQQAADRTDAAKFGAQVDKDRLDAEREYNNLITGQANLQRQEQTGLRSQYDQQNLSQQGQGLGLLNSAAGQQLAADTALGLRTTDDRLNFMGNSRLMQPGGQLDLNTLLQTAGQVGSPVPQAVQSSNLAALLGG